MTVRLPEPPETFNEARVRILVERLMDRFTAAFLDSTTPASEKTGAWGHVYDRRTVVARKG